LLAQPITKNTAQQGIYITQDQTLEQLMEKQQPEQQRIVKSFEHNVGQLLMASFIAQSWTVMLYLPVLSVLGILSGIAIGIAANY
ncbi:Gx transporter family protein, partial [Enterococcus faecium]|uniref:Gx transporter family protein n=1 Tax=Enterococcus faecium TaxID=1352 RepID=UPI00292E1111